MRLLRPPTRAGFALAALLIANLASADDAGSVPITFVGNVKDLTFYASHATARGSREASRGARRRYEPLCAAPCAAPVLRGPQTLAVSLEGRAPAEAAVNIDGPATIEATYTSHRDVRTAAYVVGGVGLATALTAPFVLGAKSSNDSGGTATYVVGGIAVGVTVIAFLVALASHDTVDLRVMPSPVAAASGEWAASRLRLTASGMALVF